MIKSSELLLTFLVNSLWQIILIAVITGLLARLLKRAPARHQQLLWVVALSLSILLPLLSVGFSLASQAAAKAASEMAQTPIDDNGATGNIWLGEMLRGEPPPLPLAPSLAVIMLFCYLGFLGYRAVRLLLAWRRTRQLRIAAIALPLPELLNSIATSCRAAFALTREIPILISTRVSGPVTLGARVPIILLPPAIFHHDSVELLTSTLAHEMAHIRRRDYLCNLIYELAFLPVSFHPAAVLIKRRIDGLRELACDEMVTEQLLDGRTYARALVTLAGAISITQQPNYTLGVFDADILEERIMKLTRGQAQTGRRLGRLCCLIASLMLAIFSVSASAFSLNIAEGESAINNVSNPAQPQVQPNAQSGNLIDNILCLDRVKQRLQVLSNIHPHIMHLVKFIAGDNLAAIYKAHHRALKVNDKTNDKDNEINGAAALALVGSWRLKASTDGKPAENDAQNAITIVLKVEHNRLLGTAVLTIGENKREWPLITPKFDGKTFTFKVDNGEELLDGSLQLSGDRLIGRWVSTESRLSGNLEMTRKE